MFGAISNDGLILKKDSILTRSSEDPGQLFDKIFEKINVWKKELNNRYLFKDIGIGVPNGNYFTGMVKDPPNLGQEWLRNVCGRSQVPVPALVPLPVQ